MYTCKTWLLLRPQFNHIMKILTLCPWHARLPRAAAGTPPPTLGCSRQQSEGEWSVFPPDLCSSHSEPCTTTGERQRRRGTINMNIGFLNERDDQPRSREDGDLWSSRQHNHSRRTLLLLLFSFKGQSKIRTKDKISSRASHQGQFYFMLKCNNTAFWLKVNDESW